MPRKPKKDPAAPASVIPDYIESSPLLRKTKVTKRKLPSYTEAMLLLHMPEMQRKFFRAVLMGLDAGDKDFVRMAGEMCEHLKRGGGVTVTQQVLNQTNMAATQDTVTGYDALVRRLAEARNGQPLPSPEVVEAEAVRPDTAG